MGRKNAGDYSALGDIPARHSIGVPILTYHKLGSLPRGVKMKSLHVSEGLFSWQIRELQESGFSMVSLDEWRKFGGEERQAVITFDDGSCSVFRHALPLLAERGIVSIQFIVAGELGGTNRWDVEALGEAPDRLMDESRIRDWLAAGQEIGAHTMTHARLTEISEARAREEIGACKKNLEDVFGREIRHFCYPYGKWSARIRDLVAEAGYETAVTLDAGSNGADCDPHALKRWGVRHPSRKLGAVGACLRHGPPLRHLFRW